MLAPVVQAETQAPPPSSETRTVPDGGTAGAMVKVTEDNACGFEMLRL